MPGKMPPIGASIASGNRMSKLNAADMRAVSRTAPKPAPKKAAVYAMPARVGMKHGGRVGK